MPAPKRPGKIISFYSYKGGTGRSMALANMAWVLASNGKRVLIVDWDLEAPGLHRFIHPFLDDKSLSASTGVLDFVVDFSAEVMTPPKNPEVPLPDDWYKPYANILRHAVPLNWKSFRQPGVLHFIPAGKQDSAYAKKVNAFNWQKFYEAFGGFRFFEAAKEKMKAEYDYVLIDSRTGVSDTSGICTVQMPDVLVVCFTLNSQSIEGARAVAESVNEQRRTSSGAPDLRIYPVPTRVETGEKERLEIARSEAWAKFSPFLRHISRDELNRYWGEVEILYQPFYAYEEVLATFGDKPNQTNSLLASVERLTGYVTEGDVTQLVPPNDQERRNVLWEYARHKPSPEPIGDETSADEFWFYLSYAGRDLDDSVVRFYKDLSAEVRRFRGLGDGIVGCLPRRSPTTSPDDFDRIERALLNSRVLVPLYSPAYFKSEQCARELNFFSLLSEVQLDESGSPNEGMRVLPVNWINSDPLPSGVQSFVKLAENPSEALSYIIRLQRHEDDYRAFVIWFTRMLITVANDRVPKLIAPRIPLRDASASFAGSERMSVFISYGLGDSALAHSIASSLDDQGFQVLNTDPLPGDGSWFEVLDERMGKASCVLVLVGAGGMSPSQKRELDSARHRQGEEEGQSLSIIPVLLPGAEPKSLAGFLPLKYWLDCRSGLVKLGELPDMVRQWQSEKAAPSAPLSDFICPYPGLRPFNEEEARLFFGREVLSTPLYERLKRPEPTAVIGPSGSGKSSLITAGLLPLLRRQRPPEPVWEILITRPGPDPVLSLASELFTLNDPAANILEARALSRNLSQGDITLDAAARTVLKQSGADRLLIVLDQFENLFTLNRTDAVRQTFASLVFEIPDDSPVRVLITLRSEFYPRLIALTRASASAFVLLVTPMSQDELRRVIENPAWLVGLKFQPGLVERIIDDFKDEPGSLPLLEATLLNLWERREGDLLTHKAYQDLAAGGGVIVQMAESLVAGMSETERDAALSGLTRMVNISNLTRLEVKLSELNAAEMEAVDRFTNARLVTIDRNPENEGWAQLAFDALLVKWERLTAFIDSKKDFLLWRQTLRPRVNNWVLTERSPAELLSATDAKQGTIYLKRRGNDLNENERAYVEASLARARNLSTHETLRTLGTAASGVVIALGIMYWQFKGTSVKPSTSLAGRVVNAQTQQPVRNARVTVGADGMVPVVYTDSNGMFVVTVPKSNAPVKALVSADNYQNYTATVPVSGTENLDIQLRPTAAGKLTIKVTSLPTYGAGGPNSLTLIAGRVNTDNPQDFRVVIYAYTNRWYIQPTTSTPLIEIQSDGSWAADIHQGSQYAVLLVPSNFKPPAVTDTSPEKLSYQIIDFQILQRNQ